MGTRSLPDIGSILKPQHYFQASLRFIWHEAYLEIRSVLLVSGLFVFDLIFSGLFLLPLFFLQFLGLVLLLTPGVNFINVLRAALTRADPESAKNTVKLSVFFPLLGSASVKAACRTLMILTPGGW